MATPRRPPREDGVGNYRPPKPEEESERAAKPARDGKPRAVDPKSRATQARFR